MEEGDAGQKSQGWWDRTDEVSGEKAQGGSKAWRSDTQYSGHQTMYYYNYEACYTLELNYFFCKKNKKDFIYLFHREVGGGRAQAGEQQAEGEGEADSPLSKEPTGWIPGLWDHDLS